MGQEIASSRFTDSDFEQFSKRVDGETRLLADWHDQGAISESHGSGGYELEAWLVDSEGHPAPINERYLQEHGSDLVTTELSKFNIELNSDYRPITGAALGQLHSELQVSWDQCRRTAKRMGVDVVMIGILPTVTEGMLTAENMTNRVRYHALNEQVMRARGGRPIRLKIHGEEPLHSTEGDIMFEAVATSFQLHLQVEPKRAASYYNAAQILSAAIVALSANSPLLFGHRLWHETRIPAFEQAVSLGGDGGAAFGPIKRVCFGDSYLRQSLVELFFDNTTHFPPLLPELTNTPTEQLSHLRLHNSTIWRWNRPLVGFDSDGTPHLRIEHRVNPAGPTVVDTTANAALFFGLVEELAQRADSPEQQLPFYQVRDNFFAAAKQGLNAHVKWYNGASGRIADLLPELLQLAAAGLARLGCDQAESDYYLGILHRRVKSGQTGAQWQLDTLDANGGDLHGLLAAYQENQQSGEPVHRWPQGRKIQC